MATARSDDEEPERADQPSDGLHLQALRATSDAVFPLAHDYFEIVYTPVVGPTAILLARTMARHLAAAGGPTTVPPVELAVEVGIRASSTDPLGSQSRLVRTIDRLVHNHVVERLGDRTLGVRLAVPPLSARALKNAPDPVRRAHERMTSEGTHPEA